MKAVSPAGGVRAFSTEDWERQQLAIAIAAEIESFSKSYGGQVNLASEAARRHLASAIVGVVERATPQ